MGASHWIISLTTPAVALKHFARTMTQPEHPKRAQWETILAAAAVRIARDGFCAPALSSPCSIAGPTSLQAPLYPESCAKELPPRVA